MNKFSCLVIKGVVIKRCWMNSEQVIGLLSNRSDVAVYRCSNDQEAVVQEGQLFWIDVPLGDEYKE